MRLVALALVLLSSCTSFEADSEQAVRELRDYLVVGGDPLGDLPAAEVPLTAADSAEAARLLWSTYLRQQRAALADDAPEEVVYGESTMRYAVRTFGQPPEGGHSLYLSLHGGGGTTAEVNDQQWSNQQRLYTLDEGIYVAPRAPTDTWNLWHQAPIDGLLDALILRMALEHDIDYDRVYLLGYSAGGDGVYQLAPRLADRYAAAGMMAGHPNNARPYNLRNLAFTIHMGGQDTAFDRAEVAESWGEQLASLQADDPEGYPHWVEIYPQHGHWMHGDDAQAIPWMAGFDRVAVPSRVVWRQDDVIHPHLYWLGVDPVEVEHGTTIIAEAREGVITVEQADVSRFSIALTDALVDLDQPIRVEGPSGEIWFEGSVERTIGALGRSLSDRRDPGHLAPARVEIAVE